MAHETDPSSSAQKPSVLLGLLGTLACVFGAWIFSKVSSPNTANSREDDYSSKHDAEPSGQTYKIPNPLPISVPAGIETHKSASDKKEDADYQTKNLFWGRLTFAAVFVYAAVALLQWCALLESNHLTKQALDLSQRPWVGITDIKINSEKMEGGQDSSALRRVEISVNTKNWGNYPGQRVSISFNRPQVTGRTAIHTWKNLNVCKDAEQASRNPDVPAGIVFPGQTTEQPNEIAFTGLPAVMLVKEWIVVCVVYQNRYGELRHMQGLYLAVPKDGQTSKSETPPGLSNRSFEYVPIDHFMVEDSDAN